MEESQRQPDILNLSINNNYPNNHPNSNFNNNNYSNNNYPNNNHPNNNFNNTVNNNYSNNMNGQGLPADLREEYLRKKKEEELIKNSMGGEEMPLGGSGVSANKPRNDKKILDCNWDY